MARRSSGSSSAGRHQQHPARALGRLRPGIGVVAVGGAGVQRAVGDDLQRAHGEQTAGAGDLVAGAQPARDRFLEVRRPDRAHDAQLPHPGGDPGHPAVELPWPLVVDHAHHPAGRGSGGRLRGVAVQHRRRQLHEPFHDRMPVRLPDHAGRVPAHAVPVGGRAVDPAAVQVGGDQHHRHRAADPVQQLPVRPVGPQRVPEPGPDQRRPGRRRIGAQPLGHQRRGGRRRPGRAEVQPLPGQRPLVEVHVVVPQPGQQGPPVQLDDLGIRRGGHLRPDRGQRPVLDEDVHRDPVQACATQQCRADDPAPSARR